jgi:hypothetical protein
MRKPKKIRVQLELFPSPEIQSLPRQIDPKAIRLLARLLSRHAEQKTAASLPEASHE